MQELPPYPDSTILVVEVGSTAHGTGLPGGEDHDEIAIWVEPASDIFGLRDAQARALSVRSQPEGSRSGPGDTDRMLYPVRRFLNLAAAGNPSIMLAFWAPVIRTTPLGDELRGLGPSFVGRHLVPRYRGYMHAQIDRLLGRRGGRHGQLRRDSTGVGYDTKYAMHAARLGYQGIELLTTGQLVLPIGGEIGDWLRSVRRGEIPLADWERRVADLDRRLQSLAEDPEIPPGPDRERLVEWSIAAHRWSWGNPAVAHQA